MTELKVGVLGCGPAGLMAAHAASMAGCDVRIFSKPRKSFMRGAQYLHANIPGTVEAEPFNVSYRLVGGSDIYRQKVYGIDIEVDVSPDSLAEEHPAWDIRAVYDWLWDTYGGYVIPWDAVNREDAQNAGTLGSLISQADLVISTIPAQLLCTQQELHGFVSTAIWATDKCFSPHIDDNTVVCDGTWERGWYRASRIQGWENTEWPHDKRPPLSESQLWQVLKPIRTNCDCWPDVVRSGRYGRWEKGVLSHDSYFDTLIHVEKRLAENG